MTLHDAIEKLLRQNGHPMTTTDIARELNRNKWYQKKDNSAIQPFQIHGRAKNYPQIFNLNGSTVSINGQPNTKAITSHKVAPKPQKKLNEVTADVALLVKILMNEKNFKPASSVDSLIPDRPGLYCIRINEIHALPKPFDTHLKERNHNIIYIGIASQSLRKRFLNQELRANGHGTFFRSIGAVLGYKPAKGSLINKSNKRNYTFTSADENNIINWINRHLLVNWVEFDGNHETIESELIKSHLPLINLAKNPAALEYLSDLRAECVKIANGL